MAKSHGFFTPWYSGTELGGHPVGDLWWVGCESENGRRYIRAFHHVYGTSVEPTDHDLSEMIQAEL